MPRKKEFQETKSLQSFEGSIRSLNQHIQLLDALLNKGKTILYQSEEESIAAALGESIRSYPRLNIPCRRIDVSRTIETSQRKLHEQAIIELYRLFTNYIRNLIGEFMRTNPTPLLETIARNKDNQISYERIIQEKSYDNVIMYMADQIYRRFENERSTAKLLDKIISYSGITVTTTLKDRAIAYLEMRHLIIHNNSIADEYFIKTNNELNLFKLPETRKLPIGKQISSKAIDTVSALCKEIDKQLILKNMVQKRSIAYNE